MRLIDAEKVAKRLYNDGKALDRKNGSEEFVFGIETALEIVHSEPTADAELVVHAHWEPFSKTANRGYRCSHCNTGRISYADYYSTNKRAYCYFCGAKMDEVTNNSLKENEK